MFPSPNAEFSWYNEDKLVESNKTIQKLNADLKATKKTNSDRVRKLETKLSQQIAETDKLKEQLTKESSAKGKIEEQLKSQLESNKKLSLLNKLTKEKTDKASIAEKELKDKLEENKVKIMVQHHFSLLITLKGTFIFV